jgi:hypothetical protein
MVITGETTKAAEGAALKDQPSRQGTDGSTSTEAKTRTYTEADHKKAVSDALAEQGRKHKLALAQAERKAQEAAQSSIRKLEAERDELERTLDELDKDDEDKTRLAKLLRENKKKSDDLERRLSDYEPRIQKAEDFELTEMCREIAANYEGGDADKLKRIANRTKFNDGEDKADQIKDLADEIWAKKAEAQPKEEPPRKVDSGVTTGGKHIYTEAEIQDFNFWKANKEDIELARLEGRIRS